MAAPRVVFRCDASVAIGTGHVRRCLSLALALQALGAQCLFVLRDHGLDAAAPLRAHGLPALLLPPPSPGAPEPQAPAHAAWLGTPQAVDAADTLAALRSAGWPAADWLVVDHYALDARWHRAVQPVLGARLAAIDDLAIIKLRAPGGKRNTRTAWRATGSGSSTWAPGDRASRQ